MQQCELDHVALNATDVDRLLKFYAGLFGWCTERVDEWREGKVPFPSLRVNARTIIDLFPSSESMTLKQNSDTHLNHFCIAVDLSTFRAVQSKAQELGAEAAGGPRQLWGARGMAVSQYYKDPEGNLFEVRCYEA